MAIITDQEPPARYDWTTTPAVVYRLTMDPDGENKKYELMPNIHCDGVGRNEGPHPGTAQFSYIFDGTLAPDWPHRIEHVQPSSRMRGVVRADDRLVVAVFAPNGKPIVRFDGFATIPEAGYSESGETVNFQALATPIREFDDVIRATRWREGGTPANQDANKVVGLRAVFNPDGRGNCTPTAKDAKVKQESTGNVREYPVFLDPRATGARRWSVAGAAAYILGEHNKAKYVKNPELSELVKLLDCWQPKKPDTEIDPDDPTTYEAKPIDVNDEDVTHKPWPDALHDLISRHGFVMRYVLEMDSDGWPVWRLKLGKSNSWERKFEKTMFLQRPREVTNTAKSNVGAVRLAWDHNAITNAYVCRSKLAEYEVSVMLACLFVPAAGDVSALQSFKLGAAGFDSVRNQYRRYGLDELGLGHWDWITGATVYTVASLTKILGGADRKDSQWVQRSRPARSRLFSKDGGGRVRSHQLDWVFASEYKGPIPGPWDGTAKDKFNRCKGDYTLLEDEFGIYIGAQDPSQFSWGDHSSSARGGVLSLVEAHNDSAKRIYFRLTATLEADITVDAEAKRRKASPTKFPITRVIDGGSRFKAQLVSRYSRWGDQSEDDLTTDDAGEQLLQAETKRFATEIPPFAGPITIPWHSGAYELGDRITGVDGRGWSLMANSGPEGGPLVLPRVVGLEWLWAGRESTIVHLSDLRVGRDYLNGQ